ncbi:MAG: LytR C-terminal domain-containing protein [Parcubacteria group bacterium]|jgi:hypothetical protein
MKTKILLSSFFLLLFFGFLIQPAHAIEYGQMGGKPTNFDPNIPDSKSWFIYNLDLGTEKEDSLTVANLFNEPWIAVIYAADSIKSSSGGFALKQLTESKEEMGSWVKFYPDPKPEFASKIFEEKKTINEVCKVTDEDLEKKYEFDSEKITKIRDWCKGKEIVELEMKAGEKKDLLFVISVPANAEVGEHTGGILIQKKAKDETAQSDGSKVMLTTRVGVRIYETVPGNIIKRLAFSDFKIVKNFDEFYLPWNKQKKEKFKEYILSSSINNSGNVSTNFSENIIIKNLITQKTERIDNREFQVLRSDDFISTLAWKAPRLAYLSFQKEYTYKDSADNEQKISTEAISKWFIPWREMLIILVIVLIIWISYFFWKRYQDKHYGGAGWEDYEVAEGETVQSLINKFSIDWKTFIKTNKLKAPYILEVGKIVKVPKTETEKPAKIEPDVQIIPENKSNDAVTDEGVGEGELSDEDILNRTELFDSAVENKKIESVKISEPDKDSSKNDIIDSSLFFDDLEDSQAVIVPNKVESLSVNESKKKVSNAQPLRRSTDIQKPKVAVVEAPVAEVKEKSAEAVAVDDIITIEADKDNSTNYLKWVLVALSLIIILLLGIVGYLLVGNKKEIKAPIQTAEVSSENKEATPQKEDTLSKDSNENEQVEILKNDPLKMEIKIFNGSGIAGAAGKVKDFLVSKKYENVEAGNYSGENVVGSTVYYKEDALKDEAQWIADILKGNKLLTDTKLASSDEEKSGDIVIIIGK